MALAALMGDQAQAASIRLPQRVAKAKSVIFLFMEGGPSHLDTFDYKPLLNKLAGQSLPASFKTPLTAAGEVKSPLLDGEANELIELAAYRTFYMHRAGHWLGLDVHDVGDYKIGGEWRVLEPGMVLTVEPGIYIAPDNRDVAKKWRGIGIRIEDDVVVTKSACKVLTADAPKSVQDIEQLMAGKG